MPYKYCILKWSNEKKIKIWFSCNYAQLTERSTTEILSLQPHHNTVTSNTMLLFIISFLSC